MTSPHDSHGMSLQNGHLLMPSVVQVPAAMAHDCPGPRAWHQPERAWMIYFPSVVSTPLHPHLPMWAWGRVGGRTCRDILELIKVLTFNCEVLTFNVE